MTEPISDMLSRIRNATIARHARVEMPSSRLKVEIARILENEGYIQGFKVLEPGAGERVQVLDGDEVRPYVSAGLGYSREDRDINVSRIGWVARMLASHGVIVLVPVIAPYAAARDAVRDDHDQVAVPFAEVHVATSLEIAEARDVKGLYARARRGELRGLTGVDDPYEVPTQAELVVDTGSVDLETAVQMSKALLSAIVERDLR